LSRCRKEKRTAKKVERVQEGLKRGLKCTKTSGTSGKKGGSRRGKGSKNSRGGSRGKRKTRVEKVYWKKFEGDRSINEKRRDSGPSRIHYGWGEKKKEVSKRATVNGFYWKTGDTGERGGNTA